MNKATVCLALLVLAVGCGKYVESSEDEVPVRSLEGLLGTATSCGSSTVSTSTNLLADTAMVNAVKYGNGTIGTDSAEAASCRSRWERFLSSSAGITLDQSSWSFFDVCSETCLCDNEGTPKIETVRTVTPTSTKQVRRIIYADAGEPDQTGRSLEIERDDQNPSASVMILYIDTSKEWNRGCALNQSIGGEQPRHSDNPSWNWPHLLVGQTLDQGIGINDYDQLELKGSFKLLQSAFVPPQGSQDASPPADLCGDSAQFPPHAIGYLAIGLERTSTSDDRYEKYYGIVRLWSTEDGSTWNPHHNGPFPDYSDGLFSDPGGGFTYMGRPDAVLGYQQLSPSMTNYQTYTIDVRRLAREALYARTQQFGGSVDESHYTIKSVYFGFEVWGPYRIKLAAKDLSLTGRNFSSATCADWYRYRSPSASDHYYSTDYFTQWGGYTLEGRMAATPAYEMNGAIPLYRYWSDFFGDHLYTSYLMPLGIPGASGKVADGWTYEGAKAYVWPSAGAGRVPIYRFWNGTDHFYSTDPAEGVRAGLGYACEPSCGTPVFYMAR